MKETQIDGATAIGNAHHQSATAPEHYLRDFNHALDLRFTPEAQRTYRRQAGAVLVAQRQMKQEVADACDAQLGQVLGDFLADAIQARDGLIQRDGAGHRARFPLRR